MQKYFMFFLVALMLTSCSTTPNYERISAKYVNCGDEKIRVVEFNNHGWYRSWYVHCQGKEYFCRYDEQNTHGWNGCRQTAADPG